jgi:hypothetical protein
MSDKTNFMEKLKARQAAQTGTHPPPRDAAPVNPPSADAVPPPVEAPPKAPKPPKVPPKVTTTVLESPATTVAVRTEAGGFRDGFVAGFEMAVQMIQSGKIKV